MKTRNLLTASTAALALTLGGGAAQAQSAGVDATIVPPGQMDKLIDSLNQICTTGDQVPPALDCGLVAQAEGDASLEDDVVLMAQGLAQQGVALPGVDQGLVAELQAGNFTQDMLSGADASTEAAAAATDAASDVASDVASGAAGAVAGIVAGDRADAEASLEAQQAAEAAAPEADAEIPADAQATDVPPQPEAQAEIQVETQVETGAEAQVEAQAQAETEQAQVETEQAQAETEQAQAETETQAAAQTGAGAGAEADVQAEGDTQVAADAEALKRALAQEEATQVDQAAEAGVAAEADVASEPEVAAEPDVASADTPEAESAMTSTAEAETQAEAGAQPQAVEAETAAEADTATEAGATANAQETTPEAEAEDLAQALAAAEQQAQVEAQAQAQAQAEGEGEGDPNAQAQAEADAQAQADAVAQQDEQSSAAAAAAQDGTEEATMVEETVTEDQVRSSAEDFANSVTAAPSAQATAAPTAQGQAQTQAQTQAEADKLKADARRAGKDAERARTVAGAALLGLGAVALNNILDNNDKVVSNSGDRVVVENNGNFRVLRNDDVLLRRPGADVKTYQYSDGSTRNVVAYEDGTQVETVRAADGRVLRRTRTLNDGTQVVLFDDTQKSQAVVVGDLPQVSSKNTQERVIYRDTNDAEALARALEGADNVKVGRTFSLNQIRNIEAVRHLVPEITVDTINFETNSAAIRPQEAEELSALGNAMRNAIRKNPGEVFLVEGHTDAVGNYAYNLALSDRRAESVALALTEYFQVPPENMVLQGYGEADLMVPTTEAERANRRAAVRRITPLLQGN
ncbi:OmpA family protein [Sagittula salina]|nr:OmpA family protein [Sagittula salina]